MFRNRPVLCFILARGGSKGIPHKNTLKIAGIPLIAHSIEQAKKVKYIDKIFISTDDTEIKKISLEHGASVIDRPNELATDTSMYLDAVIHMIKTIKKNENENHIVVILETTSPIRKIEDIEKCIEMYDESVDEVISIFEVKIHPYRMLKKRNDQIEFYLNKPPFSNRQQAETLYALNGSIMVTDFNFLENQKDVIYGGKMKGFIQDELSAIDIDSKLDFEICKFIMEADREY